MLLHFCATIKQPLQLRICNILPHFFSPAASYLFPPVALIMPEDGLIWRLLTQWVFTQHLETRIFATSGPAQQSGSISECLPPPSVLIIGQSGPVKPPRAHFDFI